MMHEGQHNRQVVLVLLAVLISRIPFIFSGYGSEEDAWGLILTAREISKSGIYEVSRMPGHPVQELMLSMIWGFPSWILNLMTVIASTAGVYFFMQTLRLWGIRNYVTAGIFLAFTPVYFINSTNIMDYTWAVSLVCISMYFLAKNKLIIASIILGLACGFRITAGGMLLPFALFMYYQNAGIKNIFLFCIISMATALICFIPAFKIYGLSFFTYYEYFPYPPILKNIYKASFGAWGVTGVIALTGGTILCFYNYSRRAPEEKKQLYPYLLMSATAILIYTYSFIKIPQKSAFIIPMIPFIAVIFSVLLEKKQFNIITALVLIACFFLGVNLDDSLRGSASSPLAYRTRIGNTQVAIDPLAGTVIADHTKRKQKVTYAREVAQKLSAINKKTLIIAGWWQNELKYFSLPNSNPYVSLIYYADEKQLRDSIAAGYKIYYLPEQAVYNNLRYNQKFTEEIAEPYN